MVTISEQIKGVRREIDYRKRLYPKWVADKKLTQKEADYQIELMKYVLIRFKPSLTSNATSLQKMKNFLCRWNYER